MAEISKQSAEETTSSSTKRSSATEESSKGKKRKLPLNEFKSREWTRLTGAPAWDLLPNDSHEQQFTGRCRLFVANLPQNVTEDSLRALFSPFGAVAEIYIGKGNQFAFVKMDTRGNAESAKLSLDGKLMDNRTLRVRLAAHAAAVRVQCLPNCVSNELLHLAFSSFGQIERAVVSADDRGRSLGEGIVEFARKSSAQAALKKCHNECLLLSATPIPVVVTPLESRDEEEGVPEKAVTYALEYRSEREIGPRFAESGSVEWEMALKWKQLSSIESQRKEALEAEFRDLREGLRQQMEALKIEETTKQLREELRRMESESQKLSQQREQRLLEERRREESRRQTEIALRQQEEQLLRRNQSEDISALRRQENELRSQANALQQLLDRQEAALRQMAPEVIQQPQIDLNGHSFQQNPQNIQNFNNYQQMQQNAGNGGYGGQQQQMAALATPQFTRQQPGGHAHHYKRNRRF